MNIVTKSATLPDGRVVTLETGALAKQADGAVMLTVGETMMLATVVARKEINVETDFLPLSVDYMEKFAASGRFPGGFFKRDGRMGEGEILTSRLVDRALRPLFPDDYHGDTQVMIQLLSSDSKEQPDAYACLAASAALMASDIPFPDPVCELRVARKDGEFIINPSFDEMEACDLDLMVAATSDSINMVEGEMKEVSEEVMLEALKYAHETIRVLNKMQEELREAVGKETREYDTLAFDETLYGEIEGIVAAGIEEVSRSAAGKEERSSRIGELKSKVYEELSEKYAEAEHFDARVGQYFKKIQTQSIFHDNASDNLLLD
ncbi:MAG: polyribonucleotide nucleotidyltransferase, partial [Bacteroidota bacterium]